MWVATMARCVPEGRIAKQGNVDWPAQMLCHNFLSLCPLPPPAPLDLDNWFAKPKPDPLPVRQRSGERVKVLHLSDFHLDPRASARVATPSFIRVDC